MFTGIINNICSIHTLERHSDFASLSLLFTAQLIKNLQKGASVSVDGVCLTVTKIKGKEVFFDLMSETLQKTTFQNIQIGECVNIERSATFSDEIGGHILSGHISTTARISNIHKTQHNTTITLEIEKKWMKYVFEKGFIALNGASLTITNVNEKRGEFDIWFIPETLRKTTFDNKKISDIINVEFDSITQRIVDSVERIMAKKI